MSSLYRFYYRCNCSSMRKRSLTHSLCSFEAQSSQRKYFTDNREVTIICKLPMHSPDKIHSESSQNPYISLSAVCLKPKRLLQIHTSRPSLSIHETETDKKQPYFVPLPFKFPTTYAWMSFLNTTPYIFISLSFSRYNCTTSPTIVTK